MPATALYRHFNTAGDLLYVGISLRPAIRTNEHRMRSHWFTEVARIDIEWLPSRAEAEQAEWEAIRKERPRYNQTFAKTPEPDEKFVIITSDMLPVPEGTRLDDFEAYRQRLAAERAENVRLRTAEKQRKVQMHMIRVQGTPHHDTSGNEPWPGAPARY